MPKKNAAAQALGKRGKNKPKTLTAAALKQRRDALKKARQKRRLPPETIAAAQALARDDLNFQLPPGPLGEG
ncbi:MAG: hypothetical protein R3F13_13200 [Prosthecobacter sp.]